MSATDRRTFNKAAALLGIGAALGPATTMAASPADTMTAQSPNETTPSLAPPDRQASRVKMPAKVGKRPGWAIVGLGQLAIEEILPAFGQAKIAKLAALVSGHPDKARTLADIYDVPAANIYGYDMFDEIARNDAIDVVYIVLPNSLHAEYTIRALRAGKHVLCEKPMAPTPEECQSMIDAAASSGKTLGVAYRLRHEALNKRAAELCRSGAIGKIKTISASNCQDTKPPNIRLSAALGGGPVGDVGIYCINGACWAAGEQPSHVTAVAHWPKENPRFAEVPESVAFTLEFPSGIIASCECSFGTTVGRRYRISGDKGFVEMDPAYSYSGLSLKAKRGDDEAGTAELATLQIEQVDHFATEMDAFCEIISNGGQPETSGAMGLADVKTVNAIMAAARTGQRVAVV